jgi:predicted transcriptional regulator
MRLVAASVAASYTSGMKTAISLPDAVFRDAERLAKRLRKSRSELYREAVVEYVARHEPEAVTDALNQLAERLDTRPDEFTAAAARRVLERSEW